MVVLSAAIVNKTGRPILARQYAEMNRARIEGLLASFPKLVQQGKQHTFVETENVRYVYQPMEALFLLLVTTKSSNILEDLETLQMLGKLAAEYCGGKLDEADVSSKSFELVFAFDEVLSVGYREKVDLPKVRTFVEMESHEAMVQERLKKDKEAEATARMKEAVKAIEQKKKEQRLSGAGPSGIGGGFGSGMGSGSGGFGAGAGMSQTGPGNFGGSPVGSAVVGGGPSAAPKASTSSAPKRQEPAGLSLGGMKKKPQNDLLAQLAAEGEDVTPVAPAPGAGGAAAAASPSASGGVAKGPVHVGLEEKVVIDVNKDGGMRLFEVKGEVSLLVSDAAPSSQLKLAVALGENKGMKFMSHPKVDRGAFNASSVLGLKDPAAGFPLNTSLALLKWRLVSQDDEDLIPFTINCWPTVSGGEGQVNIEYELTNPAFELRDVTISIPVESAPRVSHADGSYEHDSRNGALLWRLPIVDSTNANGSMDFIVPGASSEDAFFPVQVSFASPKTFANIELSSVTGATDGAPVNHTSSSGLVIDNYSIS